MCRYPVEFSSFRPFDGGNCWIISDAVTFINPYNAMVWVFAAAGMLFAILGICYVCVRQHPNPVVVVVPLSSVASASNGGSAGSAPAPAAAPPAYDAQAYEPTDQQIAVQLAPIPAVAAPSS